MTTIYAATSDQVLVATRLPKVGCNNQNTVKLHVEFDSPWNGYTKSAVFHTSKDPTPYEVILSSDGNCLIPAEVLAEEAILYIGVKGVKIASSEIKASTPIKYKVLAGTPSVVVSDPTPNVYQQLISAYNVERARMDNLLANSGAASDDEVVDMRVDAEGGLHDSAGDAVRAQVNNLKTGRTIPFDTLSAVKTDAFETHNLIVPNDVTRGSYLSEKGTVYESANYTHTGKIPVVEGETVKVNYCRFITAYDSLGEVVSDKGVNQQSGTKCTYVVPTGVISIVVSWNSVSYPENAVYKSAVDRNYEPYNPVLKVTSLPKIPNEKLMDGNISANKLSFARSNNLFDKSTAIDGQYLSMGGWLYDDTTVLGTSDFISVKEGQTLYFGGMEDRMRFVTAYDEGYNAIEESGAEFVKTYPVPSGIYFIRVSYYISDKDTLMINLVSLDEPYEAHQFKIDPCFIHDGAVNSLLGSNAFTMEFSTLNAGETILLSDFPQNLKCGLAYSFFGKFTSFTGLIIGSGRTTYNAGYFVIDGTNITIKQYLSAESTLGVYPHGLTMGEYIGVSVHYTRDQKTRISVNTVSGTYTLTTAFSFTPSGLISAEVSSPMNEVKLSATYDGFKKPLWMFGDSYLGYSNQRILGQLQKLGYTEYLTQGVAGQASASAYDDFVRCLKFGTPKYLVWMLGMNDSDTNYEKNLTKVKKYCDEKDITLIAGVTPTVPTISHETKKTFVESLGIRTINVYDAVGATPSGTWYTNHLSGDGVHPSEKGAEAIAMRFLIDFPEIMQY